MVIALPSSPLIVSPATAKGASSALTPRAAMARHIEQAFGASSHALLTSLKWEREKLYHKPC